MCNARPPVKGDAPSSVVARCQAFVNTILKTEIGICQIPQKHEEKGLTSCDTLDSLIIPLETSDIVPDPYTSFELALEEVALIQE
jgi:hypothetical protein